MGDSGIAAAVSFVTKGHGGAMPAL
jgi:hypothetical protein